MSFKSDFDSLFSGLKVNFVLEFSRLKLFRIILCKVNIYDPCLHEVALVLHCKHKRIPFMYLGLPIGRDPRKLRFWYPLLDRIKNQLLGWKIRNLSMRGCLIYLKFVVSSIPVYLFALNYNFRVC